MQKMHPIIVKQFLQQMTLTPYELAALKTEIGEIEKALKLTGGNKSEAAKILQLDRKTIYNKFKTYNKWLESQSKKTGLSKAKAPQ